MEKFVLPTYKAPDFEALGLADAPDAKLVEAQQDGVAPAGYHATTMFPEYFRIHGEWQLAQDSRMDCAAVLRGGRLNVVELRNIRRGDAVVVGREENGTEGVYVHTRAFRRRGRAGDEFAFRQGRSRETAYSKDYNSIYRLLKYEKQHGNILWVLGPACTFDADARAAFSALVDEGYVNGLLAGNALATHDLEVGYRGTALGQDVYTQHSVPNGHYNHLDTINEVRRCGSVRAFVEAGHVKDGIMYTCVKKNVPFVLVGSIRDDGPLPDVYGNVYEGQDAMRGLVRKATTIVCMASTLHTVATGNMTPSYRVVDGQVRPLYFYSVDISEFAVNKLLDRGSLTVKTIVTNVQDFIIQVRRGVCS